MNASGVSEGRSTACCDWVAIGSFEKIASATPVDEGQGVWIRPVGAARTVLRLPAARAPAVKVFKRIVDVVVRSERVCGVSEYLGRKV